MQFNKMAIILTGQPRGVSLYSWRRTFVDVILDYVKKNNIQLDVFCATWSYDCLDRYQLVEPSKAGLTRQPIIGSNFNDSRSALCNLTYKITTNKENNTILYSGRIPLKREKWEEHQRSCWGPDTNLYFTYIDPYYYTEIYNDHLKIDSSTNSQVDSPGWTGQFVMIDSVYKDWRAVFETYDRNTFALRTRWDVGFTEIEHWGINRIIRYTNNRHAEGMDLSPIVTVQRAWWIKGFPTFNDYWQAYDGPGIRLLGENFLQYLKEAPDARMPGDSNKILNLHDPNPQVPDRKTNFYKIPESILAQFHYDNFYTMYSLEQNDLCIQTFNTWITDQWRYEWYEWTPEMVEQCRIDN